MPQVGLIFLAAVLITISIATWKGGGPERLGAAILAAMSLMSAFVETFDMREYARVDAAALTQDVFALVCFGTLAMYAKRVWPIWATSLQMLSFFSHLARLVQWQLPPMAYGFMKSMPTFLATIALLIGTLAHWKRMRGKKFVYDWKHW